MSRRGTCRDRKHPPRSACSSATFDNEVAAARHEAHAIETQALDHVRRTRLALRDVGAYRELLRARAAVMDLVAHKTRRTHASVAARDEIIADAPAHH